MMTTTLAEEVAYSSLKLALQPTTIFCCRRTERSFNSQTGRYVLEVFVTEIGARDPRLLCTVNLEITPDPSGQFLIISARRGCHEHKVALLYSSSTDNLVYKTLAQQVEHIYYRGEPYQLEAHTRRVEKPVSRSRDFGAELVRWNRESSEGKFSPTNDDDAHVGAERPPLRRLLSEEPIAAIWLRLRQLQSVRIAKKLIAARVRQANVELDEDTLRQKAEGIAYALRNAADYFNVRDLRNASQRVLNLYYGSLAFASAEMLASPHGAKTLSEIEKSTVQGHGLYTVDGAADGLLLARSRTAFFLSGCG